MPSAKFASLSATSVAFLLLEVLIYHNHRKGELEIRVWLSQKRSACKMTHLRMQPGDGRAKCSDAVLVSHALTLRTLQRTRVPSAARLQLSRLGLRSVTTPPSMQSLAMLFTIHSRFMFTYENHMFYIDSLTKK